MTLRFKLFLIRTNPVNYYLVISVSFNISRTEKLKKSLSRTSVEKLNVSNGVSDMSGALIISQMSYVAYSTKIL